MWCVLGDGAFCICTFLAGTDFTAIATPGVSVKIIQLSLLLHGSTDKLCYVCQLRVVFSSASPSSLKSAWSRHPTSSLPIPPHMYSSPSILDQLVSILSLILSYKSFACCNRTYHTAVCYRSYQSFTVHMKNSIVYFVSQSSLHLLSWKKRLRVL